MGKSPCRWTGGRQTEPPTYGCKHRSEVLGMRGSTQVCKRRTKMPLFFGGIFLRGTIPLPLRDTVLYTREALARHPHIALKHAVVPQTVSSGNMGLFLRKVHVVLLSVISGSTVFFRKVLCRPPNGFIWEERGASFRKVHAVTLNVWGNARGGFLLKKKAPSQKSPKPILRQSRSAQNGALWPQTSHR